MDDAIRTELFDVEREHPIHIVNARQRGSRMLGAEHDGSDYDVMFLFSQDAANYATIHGRVDSIHDPHRGENEDIDLHGWNIDKFARLARDSNPNAVEYCREDPKEYITFHGGGTFDRAARELRENFNHMSLYHHYLSMAERNYFKYIESGNDCTKGRQFYVIRGIAMAEGIRRGGELPPLDARELADYQPIDVETRKVLAKLTEAKRAGHGPQESPDIVGEFYEREEAADMKPITDKRIDSPDDEVLDEFIRETVVR